MSAHKARISAHGPQVRLENRLLAYVSKNVGGVKRGEEFAALEVVVSAAQLRDSQRRAQERLDRDVAERADPARLDPVELLEKVRQARRHLVGPGRPVVRRPALEDIGDVDLSRRTPTLARHCVSSCPARPTNGSPCRSSSAPGASPTNTTGAWSDPTPNTTWVRVSQRPHLRHWRTSSRNVANSGGTGGAASALRLRDSSGTLFCDASGVATARCGPGSGIRFKGKKSAPKRRSSST